MKQLQDIHIAIVSSSFRKEIADQLELHCITTLKKQGVREQNIFSVRVPGSLEIPLIAKQLAKKSTYDAIITFGAIVKGKTYHFEQIADECIRGCMEVSRAYDIPVIFEVLAVYDLADALGRATRKEENKGVEAAQTALAMIALMENI